MGSLPAWQQGDLPHPPAFGLRNAVRVIGPGPILLGLSLGPATGCSAQPSPSRTVPIFTLAGCAVLPRAEPFSLILIGANLAGLNFVILAFHTLWVNRRLLPRELRPARWREVAVALCGLFFGALVVEVASIPGCTCCPAGRSTTPASARSGPPSMRNP